MGDAIIRCEICGKEMYRSDARALLIGFIPATTGNLILACPNCQKKLMNSFGKTPKEVHVDAEKQDFLGVGPT